MKYPVFYFPLTIPLLAYLIQPYRELQLLAADSDRLITTLVEYLQDRPDENDDLVQEKHLNQFDRLRESVFLALAGLGSNREEIRLKIVSERNMLKSLSEGLNGDNVNIKITAMRSINPIVCCFLKVDVLHIGNLAPIL